MKTWRNYYEAQFLGRSEGQPQQPVLRNDPRAAFDAVIAQRISRRQIPALLGFIRQDFVVGPNEAAVVIENGKVVQVAAETRLPNVGSGLVPVLQRVIGRGRELELVLVSTAPKTLELAFAAPASDGEPVQGKAVVHIQVAKADAPDFLKAMSRRERLAIPDLADILRDEAVATVLEPQIRARKARDLRGDLALQRAMEAAALAELQRSLQTFGLHVTRFFLVWGKTAFEELKGHEDDLRRREASQVAGHPLELEALGRAHASALLQQEQAHARMVAGITQEQEAQIRAVRGEIERASAQHAERARQTRIDQEIALQRQRDAMLLEQEALDRSAGRTMDQFAKVQAAKMERMRAEQEHQQKQQGMEQDFLQRISSEPHLSPETVQEISRQATLKRALDREPEKVAALAAAEAKRHELSTYKDAEDRERRNALETADRAARLMDAAKPNVPSTNVQGGVAPANVHVTGQAGGVPCPTCGTRNPAGARYCSQDGALLPR